MQINGKKKILTRLFGSLSRGLDRSLLQHRRINV